MKKILAALLALTFTICTAFAFTACDLDDLFGNNNGGGTTDGNGTDGEDDSSDDKDNPPVPDCGFFIPVTVTGIDDLFYEPLENLYEIGTEVEVKLNVITDIDLYVFVNGKRIERSHYDSDYWGYKFTMPKEEVDVVIHITSDKYYGVENCDFNVPFYWVDYCKPNSVVKIKCESGYIGVCPDILPEIIYTTDKTDIENVCAIFNYKLKPCANPHIDGGSYVIYTFYTTDGGEYSLEIDNGYTSEISFTTYDCFKIVDLKLPKILNPEQ